MARSSPRHRKSGSRARSTTPGFPHPCRRVLPAGGGARAGAARLRRVLRQAAAQVRAPAGDLSGLCAARLPLVPAPRCRCGSSRSCTCRARFAGGLGGEFRKTLRLHRASRIARGERVLPLAVRRGGDSHARRRRRVGHRELRDRPRQSDPADPRAALPALARAALLGIHLLLRLPRELGRVQADGARPVRRADLRRSDPREADRSEGRRLVPHGHVVLQLLPGPDDDVGPKFHDLFGGPPRRPESPITQREMDLAASIQEVTEEIMLRCARHVQQQTGLTQPVPGRRRGAQLRRQRQDPARRAVRADLDPAGRGRRGRRARRRAVHLAPTAGPAANAERRATRSTVRCSARASTEREIRAFLERAGARYEHIADEDALCDRVAGLLGRGEGRRLDAGTDGVRATRAGESQHHRRRTQRRRCSR